LSGVRAGKPTGDANEHGRENDHRRRGAAARGTPLWCTDAGGHGLPVACRPWPVALPHAWLRRREITALGRAARQPERLEGRLLGRCRPPAPPPDDRLHPGRGGKPGGTGSDEPFSGPFSGPFSSPFFEYDFRSIRFGCMGLFSVFSHRCLSAGIAGISGAAGQAAE